MNWFSTFLKRVPPFKAALGLVLLFGTASFSLGAASVNLVGIPARTTELEIAQIRIEAVQEEILDKFDRHIYQDSIANDRIYWILCLMAEEDGPVSPLDCEPGGTQ
jgi:hypothetical protein